MKYPRYSYPLHLAAGFIRDVLLVQRRSFLRDSRACIDQLEQPLQVYGMQNIPTGGPCVLTMNHYHRSGFGAWWLALAVAAMVPEEMHWVMTGELTFPGKWYAFLGRPFSRWLLKRLANIYGFTSMPPMPPRKKDVTARARSVRAMLEYVRLHPGSMLALAPEGRDDLNGVLAWPPSGAGRFLHLLDEAGFSFIPVGIWEENGALCLRFGAAYNMQVPSRPGLGEKDHLIAGIVMQAIACQLPQSLRGEFQ